MLSAKIERSFLLWQKGMLRHLRPPSAISSLWNKHLRPYAKSTPPSACAVLTPSFSVSKKIHRQALVLKVSLCWQDFEPERKWKLAQAKKMALSASKGMLDQASRGEKKLKEEEQRLRKIAVNISKDVKKFWMKIEKRASH